MSPVEQGRFCSVCKIAVTDFTQMDEQQIADHIKQYGLHCGRFNAAHVSDGTSYGSWQHYFKWKSALALLLMGSMFLASCRRHVSGCAAYSGEPEKKRKKQKTEKVEEGKFGSIETTGAGQ